MKYVYPTVITPEDCGFSVDFPDVHNCYTSGETLPEALEMAEDVLCMMLYNAENRGTEIPPATPIEELQQNKQSGQIVSLVDCDTLAYRKLYDNRAVKKTLSIPSWLNDLAEQAGINFSGVLQAALKKQLNV